MLMYTPSHKINNIFSETVDFAMHIPGVPSDMQIFTGPNSQ